MDADARTLLVTLTGTDRPGVTMRLFASLDSLPVAIVDVEQIVVRTRLTLAVLLETPDAAAAAATQGAITAIAAELAMDVEIVPGAGEDEVRRRNRVHVTIMGAPLTPAVLASVSAQIAERGGNIDRIRRIASYPVTAIVLEGSGVSVADLRRPLAATAAVHGADIAVQEASLDSRGQYLVVLDVDSTFIQDEVIDLLAEEAGALPAVGELTARAMAGELDFEQSLRARVRLLAGLPESVLEKVRSRVTLTPGARTLCRTLRRLGYRVALVSGGFTEVIAPIASELGVTDVRANSLEIVDGRLTGNVLGQVVDRQGKRAALEEFAEMYGIPKRRTIAVGDGANDVDMLAAAGLGVAFNAKPAARDAADTAVSHPYLDSVLFLLGVTREEIEAADARDER